MKKRDLPSKICPVCQRPFSWRRKWQRDWHEVRYCSKRCKQSRNTIEESTTA
ncbi:DUF2256 domain-containing protein [Candidatus Marimicrobium litorale]|uniref:DUF2256 domain-containing protein n=1 Tax=Candidatus Marimicrobium litorale TaxID=2518991 RepID=A0ABT3T8Y0_9GAMM|nr:DUF2256 domain-containing protein [Candidatus Marimicrobium litorale]MCX2978630.1 DUF2256 domain-containing protein [Candidatus Marimicrobium litorale]